VLAAGAAGQPHQVSGRLLYSGAAVDELARRDHVDVETLLSAVPGGLMVARLRVDRWHAQMASTELEATMGGPWPMSLSTYAWGALAARGLVMPYVAISSGLVVGCREIQGVMTDDDGDLHFTFRRPGPWAAAIENRWWRTHRGGSGLTHVRRHLGLDLQPRMTSW
jgi:hypothetical protein